MVGIGYEAYPVPVRLVVMTGFTGSLLDTESVPVRVPAAVGVKVIKIRQDDCWGSGAAQLPPVANAKSPVTFI